MNTFDFIRNSLNRIADGIASSDGSYPVWDYRTLMELMNTLEKEYKKNDEASARSSLQQTCNNLATDCVYRQEAIDAMCKLMNSWFGGDSSKDEREEITWIINHLPSAQQWIPCSERLPECEQEVLICTEKKVYVSKKTGMEWYKEPVITPALYEDGTMLEVNSKWRWEDIDYAGWDDEEDCGIIPEGWWENRHFNPDEVYNNVVDRKVIAWMSLPEPYKERREDG